MCVYAPYLCSGGTWVHEVQAGLPVFWVVPGYMLRLKRVYFSKNFAFVRVFMIYLCLGGTRVPAVTEGDLFGLV